MEVSTESSRISLAYESNLILLAGIRIMADRAVEREVAARPKEKFRMSSSILLVGAVFASLAFGVLLAYGICHAMFRMFRVHAESTARRSQAARMSASTGS